MGNVAYLAHHGTKGQKWGVRKYQNPDGSLTPLGRAHYGVGQTAKAGKNAGAVVGKEVKKTGSAVTNAAKKAYGVVKSKQEAKKQHEAEVESHKSINKLKRIREMSDKELEARIHRLEREAKLVELEADAHLSPGMKYVKDTLVKKGSEAAGELAKSYLTKKGKEILGLEDEGDKAKKYENALKVRQARDAYEEYVREAPERIKDARTERAIKRAQDAIKLRQTRGEYMDMISEGQERDKDARTKKAIERTQDALKLRQVRDEYDAYVRGKKSEDSYSESGIKARKEKERRVKAYRKDGEGLSIPEIARRMGISESEVKDLLYE